jgi:spore coat polysaccharide biosynthesis protein SpsF (cytidylyltransferase family)/aryl-alcohol dehydrogenase-like predicted oxidoreductase
MNNVIVLQARTSSSRLPGKVMLPITGIPLVVLAAKRAANTGHSVIVATSSEPSDDGLVALLESYDLKYFRGSLENTLDRIVKSLLMYDDQTVVFRLTADNVFPDGALLDEIESEFLSKGLEYLCCNGEPSGLPYGMSVEVTRLGNLREAEAMSTSAHDREHVTPYIIRKYGALFFEKYKSLKKGHYRCTVDCLDDYTNIQKVFSDVIDPVYESSLELVRRLEQIPLQPFAPVATPKLVLGTAQLGGDYGIANTTGQPSSSQCQQLIKTAIANGVMYLDTAHGYGNSEAMIGGSLKDGWEGRAKIITKLSPLQDCAQDLPSVVLNAFVDASIYKSCTSLRVQKIDVLMLHRASHISDWNGAVWQRLLELKLAGVIRELGVSIQSPEELSKVLKNEEIRYIQLPFNLLDWRWDSIIPTILSIKAERKLTIHVRSALLQGLLPSLDDCHWLRANVDNPVLIKDWLSDQVRICQRAGVVDLCLSYVNALAWVDGIAIGMENMSQLIANINYFNLPPMSESQVEKIQRSRPRLIETSLNPALWRKQTV